MNKTITFLVISFSILALSCKEKEEPSKPLVVVSEFTWDSCWNSKNFNDFSIFEKKENLTHNLANGRINHLSVSKVSGAILVGTNKGADYFDFAQQKWLHIGKEDGLPSDTITGVDEDSKGRLWMATPKGLCRYDWNSMQLFSKNEGLLNNHTKYVAVDQSDNVWVGHTTQPQPGSNWEENGLSLISASDVLTFTENNGLPVGKRLDGITITSDNSVWVRFYATKGNGINAASQAELLRIKNNEWKTFTFDSIQQFGSVFEKNSVINIPCINLYNSTHYGQNPGFSKSFIGLGLDIQSESFNEKLKPDCGTVIPLPNSIVIDEKSNIWYTTSWMGYPDFGIRTSNGEYYTFRSKDLFAGIESAFYLAIDPKGSVIVGGKNGLWKIEL
ncbi:MAG: hypothetical protein H6607_03005 [Flavobacteriales bacterium]|nr:hypothetical protein [Flavobacteriales bacterium]